MTKRSGSAEMALLGGVLVFAACAVAQPSDDQPEQPFTRVLCGGPPAFHPGVLDQEGGAEGADDPAAAALRAALAPTGGDIDEDLPNTGWIEVTRTESMVKYLARGGNGPGLAIVIVKLRDGQGRLDASGRCELLPEIRPGLELAMFRVAPGQQLTPEMTEVEVLVTELGCNSGQDARGRVRVERIVPGDSSVIVVMATAPRDGAQECPDNPETPFLLELPEPLGDRALLDGYSIPPRDARECHPFAC
jgi:hypothetical protein